MKRQRIKIPAMIAILVFAMTFFACQKTENTLLSEFKSMTETTPELQGLTKAVEFMDFNIPAVSQEGASRMVLAYEDYLLRFLEQNSESMDQTTAKNLFLILPSEEESSALTIDYDSLIRAYEEYVSIELKDLFIIKANEAGKPSTQDAQITLSYPELLERALTVETLIGRHKSEDSLRANAIEYYEEYLFLLFAGTDYSPLFDYSSGEFSPKAKEAYEDFIVANPDTVLASALTEYFSYLNDIKFRIDYSDATENKVFYDTCDYLIQGAIQSLE